MSTRVAMRRTATAFVIVLSGCGLYGLPIEADDLSPSTPSDLSAPLDLGLGLGTDLLPAATATKILEGSFKRFASSNPVDLIAVIDSADELAVYDLRGSKQLTPSGMASCSQVEEFGVDGFACHWGGLGQLWWPALGPQSVGFEHDYLLSDDGLNVVTWTSTNPNGPLSVSVGPRAAPEPVPGLSFPGELRFSPVTRHFYFVDGEQSLFRLGLGDPVSSVVRVARNVKNVLFSDDGQWIALTLPDESDSQRRILVVASTALTGQDAIELFAVRAPLSIDDAASYVFVPGSTLLEYGSPSDGSDEFDFAQGTIVRRSDRGPPSVATQAWIFFDYGFSEGEFRTVSTNARLSNFDTLIGTTWRWFRDGTSILDYDSQTYRYHDVYAPDLTLSYGCEAFPLFTPNFSLYTPRVVGPAFGPVMKCSTAPDEVVAPPSADWVYDRTYNRVFYILSDGVYVVAP